MGAGQQDEDLDGASRPLPLLGCCEQAVQQTDRLLDRAVLAIGGVTGQERPSEGDVLGSRP